MMPFLFSHGIFRMVQMRFLKRLVGGGPSCRRRTSLPAKLSHFFFWHLPCAGIGTGALLCGRGRRVARLRVSGSRLWMHDSLFALSAPISSTCATTSRRWGATDASWARARMSLHILALASLVVDRTVPPRWRSYEAETAYSVDLPREQFQLVR